MADAQTEALERRMLDAITEAVRGSEWAPPEGGLIVEAVVVMGWVDSDGDSATSHLRCGSAWGTEGLLVDALRHVRMQAEQEQRRYFEGEDEDDGWRLHPGPPAGLR